MLPFLSNNRYRADHIGMMQKAERPCGTLRLFVSDRIAFQTRSEDTTQVVFMDNL